MDVFLFIFKFIEYTTPIKFKLLFLTKLQKSTALINFGALIVFLVINWFETYIIINFDNCM